MAHIFISYSRRDEEFVRKLATSLSELGANVWIDVEDIPAGMKWSSAIQQGLRESQIMLVILSPDSTASTNVEDEWQDFLDNRKPIIPVLWRPVPSTDIHFQLRRIQYIDFHHQHYEEAFRQLTAELGRKGASLATGKADDTPPSTPTARPPTRSNASRSWLVVGLALVVTLVAAAWLLSSLNNVPPASTPSSTPVSSGEFVAIASTSPTPDDREAALQTRDAIRTLTATASTATPSPDRQATIDAGVTALYYEDLTATATLFTPTPSPTSTFTPTTAPGYPGGAEIQHNGDWTVVVQDFDGVKMVLVPNGCFMMGSETEGDEQPIEKQCLSAFWIDQTEVTNEQFDRFDGVASETSYWKDPLHPREQINWFESRDFCVRRGAQLPTEAEWEYAGRGPDNLIYPWGNSYVAANAAIGSHTEDVGSHPKGASWVGAFDMSGNVFEWNSSQYQPYPYEADDGRENLQDQRFGRVVRSGSFAFGATVLRLANRRNNAPDYQPNDIGFRCSRAFAP